jgi:hypothetical protein
MDHPLSTIILICHMDQFLSNKWDLMGQFLSNKWDLMGQFLSNKWDLMGQFLNRISLMVQFLSIILTSIRIIRI